MVRAPALPPPPRKDQLQNCLLHKVFRAQRGPLRGMGFGSDAFLAVCPWASHVFSLISGFLLCQVEMISPAFEGLL